MGTFASEGSFAGRSQSITSPVSTDIVYNVSSLVVIVVLTDQLTAADTLSIMTGTTEYIGERSCRFVAAERCTLCLAELTAPGMRSGFI